MAADAPEPPAPGTPGPELRKQDEDGSGRVSRRAFLRGSALGALTTGILPASLLPDVADGQAGPPPEGVVGPGPVAMRFQINGRTRTAKLEPRVTLLDALRNHLSLTGAKKVCDRGTCGACTVLLGGRAVYACSILAIEAQHEPIETIESLGSPEALHPIQAAFVEHDATQCGFCTPGFVMASKALLDAIPSPGPEDLARGLGGNLCRCGTYAGIRQALLSISGVSKKEGA